MKPFHDKHCFEKIKGGLYGLLVGVVFDVGIQTSAALVPRRGGSFDFLGSFWNCMRRDNSETLHCIDRYSHLLTDKTERLLK